MTGSQPLEYVAEHVGSDRLFVLVPHFEGPPIAADSALAGRFRGDASNMPADALTSRFRSQGIAEKTSSLYYELL